MWIAYTRYADWYGNGTRKNENIYAEKDSLYEALIFELRCILDFEIYKADKLHNFRAEYVGNKYVD